MNQPFENRLSLELYQFDSDLLRPLENRDPQCLIYILWRKRKLMPVSVGLLILCVNVIHRYPNMMVPLVFVSKLNVRRHVEAWWVAVEKGLSAYAVHCELPSSFLLIPHFSWLPAQNCYGGFP
jgi:hypothetical protein